MQTRDVVEDVHNCLEFSQPSLCLDDKHSMKADQSVLLSRFSTRFIYQYGVSGCKLQMRTELKLKWLIVLGSRISSSLQNLKVMTMSPTLLLLVLTLAFVFVSRGFSEKPDYLHGNRTK